MVVERDTTDDSTYSLATLTMPGQDVSSERTNPECRSIKELSQHEFDAYSGQLRALMNAFNLPQMDLLHGSYARLQSLLYFYTTLLAAGRGHGELDRKKAMYSINAEIVNWLSNKRIVLEHFATEIARNYGQGSPQFEHYKTLTASFFDGPSPYAFLYNLRDYVVHCGLPASHLALSAPPALTLGVKQIVEFLFDRDSLLSTFRWKKKARQDLAQMRSRFAVEPLIRVDMNNMEFIAENVIHTRFQSAYGGLEDLHRLVSLCPETGSPMLLKVTPTDGGNQLTFSNMPPAESIRCLIEARDEPGGELLRIGRSLSAGSHDQPQASPTPNDEPDDRTRLGAALLGAYFEQGGATPSFLRFLTDEVQRSNGNIEPAMSGMINVSITAVGLAAAAINVPPEAMLADLINLYSSPFQRVSNPAFNQSNS